MAPLPAADQRHPWLRYQIEEYTEGIRHRSGSEVEDGFTIFDDDDMTKDVYGKEGSKGKLSFGEHQLSLSLSISYVEVVGSDLYVAVLCHGTVRKKVIDLLHINPEIPIKAVQEHMQKQFQVGVSKTKAFRAQAKAEAHLRGDQEQQYALLKIDVYRAHNPVENVRGFKRIYVCLGPLKDVFRASRRELLGLDGTFMKGNYPGQMITAVSMDANNEIYLVAYGIVESESKDS
ncbi:retrovirus-related pol polyprotein [Tanacetum coccineum]